MGYCYRNTKHPEELGIKYLSIMNLEGYALFITDNNAKMYENPDYEGQTFDNYLSNYGNMTPAARRIFSGTGQKAVRREALDYAFWEAVGTGRGRK